MSEDCVRDEQLHKFLADEVMPWSVEEYARLSFGEEWHPLYDQNQASVLLTTFCKRVKAIPIIIGTHPWTVDIRIENRSVGWACNDSLAEAMSLAVEDGIIQSKQKGKDGTL